MARGELKTDQMKRLKELEMEKMQLRKVLSGPMLEKPVSTEPVPGNS